MSSNQAGLSPILKDALQAINLCDRERRLAAIDLARSEYAVDVVFAGGNALVTLLASIAARLRHGMTSSRSWFAH